MYGYVARMYTRCSDRWIEGAVKWGACAGSIAGPKVELVEERVGSSEEMPVAHIRQVCVARCWRRAGALASSGGLGVRDFAVSQEKGSHPGRFHFQKTFTGTWS